MKITAEYVIEELTKACDCTNKENLWLTSLISSLVCIVVLFVGIYLIETFSIKASFIYFISLLGFMMINVYIGTLKNSIKFKSRIIKKHEDILKDALSNE